MPLKTSKDLTILMVWHHESDERKIECFKENRKSFQFYNPEVEVVTIINPFENSPIAWLNSDLSIFNWYNEHKDTVRSKRFLLVEWDCWCDINLKTYYRSVWDYDVVAPCVKYPERDDWHWFNDLSKLPESSRLFATGIVPFSGILLSEKAMRIINDEILKPEYTGLNSELRFATIATMLGFDPVPAPVCSRSITWKTHVPFDLKYKGLHHPRKILAVSDAFDEIIQFNDANKSGIPRIIHQTWKESRLPGHFEMLSQTWKDLHPDWRYILWTDDMNRAFINRYFPDFLLQYDSYPENIQRVDAVRYFILLKMGGVFVDMDFECVENIEELLSGRECLFAMEPQEHCEQFGKEKIICNAFMATKPQNNFFYTICNSLPIPATRGGNIVQNILSTTGPFILTYIYDAYQNKNEVTLLPSSTVYPFTVAEARRAIADDIDELMQSKIDRAYAVHYFFGSWY